MYVLRQTKKYLSVRRQYLPERTKRLFARKASGSSNAGRAISISEDPLEIAGRIY
jgi:hypothetical protein